MYSIRQIPVVWCILFFGPGATPHSNLHPSKVWDSIVNKKTQDQHPGRPHPVPQNWKHTVSATELSLMVPWLPWLSLLDDAMRTAGLAKFRPASWNQNFCDGYSSFTRTVKNRMHMQSEVRPES